MAAIDEESAKAATRGATLKEEEAKPEQAAEATQEIQRQTIVYDIPKSWLKLVKGEAHSTHSAYIKAALREKLVKDGHLK